MSGQCKLVITFLLGQPVVCLNVTKNVIYLVLFIKLLITTFNSQNNGFGMVFISYVIPFTFAFSRIDFVFHDCLN